MRHIRNKMLVSATISGILFLTAASSNPHQVAFEDGTGQARTATWERVKRVGVYNSPRRARYPSVSKAKDKSLLVLFMQQSAKQEKSGQGDLVLVRSTDIGQTWSDGQVVYQGTAGVPQAIGTMTSLKNGRIIAPFCELGEAPATSIVRLLTSSDNGRNWQVVDITATCPLVWWAPCGKVLETIDGTLVMPVYGATSEANLKATIHNSGLLRSTDGGITWGEFSWIARGGRPMIGAAPDSRFSFEGPSVQSLPDGRWLALLSARRLNRAGDGPTEANEGPGAPQVLCRLWSSDKGRTWTNPDQLAPGAWPGSAVVGTHTLLANTLWSSWGEMRLEVSRDGFGTIFQELPMLSRGWLRGRLNNPQEIPLPPVVPYLADDWPFQHYGFPSIELLDQDNVVVVFGRTQRGTPYYHEFDPPEWDSISVEKEKIQAVFYRRSITESKPVDPQTKRPIHPPGRWVLAERFIVPNLGGTMAQIPNGDLIAIVGDTIKRSSDGGRTWKKTQGVKLPEKLEHYSSALGVLSNGRWLIAVTRVNQEWKSNGPRSPSIVGMVGGYPVRKLTGQSFDCEVVVWHSDNEGKTWQACQPFKGPFKWAMPTVSHFIESTDGAVALPIFGCVTDEEMDSYSGSNGVIRSRDGGKTWGDFSFVFRTHPKGPDDYQPEPRYSEMDIVQLPGGHWIAYSRHERIAGGPQGQGVTSVTVSTDFGRTWRETGASLVGVSQQKGVVLPDGGIALVYRTHSWQAPGVAITYDEGRSFSYLLTGPYETINAFMHGKKEFVVFTAQSHRSDSMAGVYRWLPDVHD